MGVLCWKAHVGILARAQRNLAPAATVKGRQKIERWLLETKWCMTHSTKFLLASVAACGLFTSRLSERERESFPWLL